VHRTATFQLDNISAWTSNLEGGASYLFFGSEGVVSISKHSRQKIKHIL